jgi:ribose/xylose/arabinose/galactoside ABC-type transport system permease subunit
VYAIGSNPTAARLAGIKTRRTIMMLFVVSGLACALAGLILTSMLGSASPTAAVGLELSVVTAIVLGGTTLSGGEGTALGTLVGLLIVGFLNNGLIIKGVDPFWQYVAQGALLIGAVSFDRLRERFSGEGRQ